MGIARTRPVPKADSLGNGRDLEISLLASEFLLALIVKYGGSFRELWQQSKRMKIGDHVYLITDRLQTGAGVPVMICALQDSTVEVFVEFTHEPKILKVSNREDILSSNLYAHSILNLVYQTYGEIEHKYGSILNLPTEEIVAQLLRRGLAPRTARHCVDLFAEVEWRDAQLPLRQWLESIRDFYHPLRPVQNPSPSPPTLRCGLPRARADL